MSCYKTLGQIDWCTPNNLQKLFSESLAPIGPYRGRGGVRGWKQISFIKPKLCSVNKPAIRFGLRLSCTDRNKLDIRGIFLSLTHLTQTAGHFSSPKALTANLYKGDVRYIQEEGRRRVSTGSVTTINKLLPYNQVMEKAQGNFLTHLPGSYSIFSIEQLRVFFNSMLPMTSDTSAQIKHNALLAFFKSDTVL